MKPQWVIGMTRTARPGDVNETVVEVLLDFFDEFVSIQRNVIDEFVDRRREMLHYRMLIRPEGGVNIAKQSLNDGGPLGFSDRHLSGGSEFPRRLQLLDEASDPVDALLQSLD